MTMSRDGNAQTSTNLLDTPVFDVFHINLETFLYISLGVIAVVACFYNLGVRAQSHDESLHALYSWKLFAGEGYEHNPMMHGPFLFHINALMYLLFGTSDFTARISAALFGVTLVLLPAFLRKELGRVGALIVSTLTLISPTTLYYARYIRNDIYMMVWAMLMAIALFRYLETRKAGWIYLGAVAVTLAVCTKETSYITGFIGFTFVIMLMVQQLLSSRAARTVVVVGLVLVIVLAIVYLLIGAQVPKLPLKDASAETPQGLTHETAKKINEVIFLLVGILVAMLLGILLIKRDGLLKLPLRLIVAYVLSILSMAVICAGLGGLVWLVVAQLPEGMLPPMGFMALQVIAVGAAVGAGAYLWWLLVNTAHREKWLPAEFQDKVLYITIALVVIIFSLLYTTFFTNPKGMASGTFGAITYWLAQQEVKRAGQPWFYYFVIAPLYEFLPIGVGLIAMLYYFVTGKVSRSEEEEDRSRPVLPLVAYLVYWTISAWLIYSWAGEKMPWMLVHVVQPMIVLSGRFADDLLCGTDWRKVWHAGGAVLALIVPIVLFAAGMIVWLVLGGQAFGGMSFTDLSDTFKWLAALVIGGALAFAGYRIAQKLGTWDTWRVVFVSLLVIFAALTLRYAVMASFINYDTAKEFLVYAHGTGNVKETVNELQMISRRLYGNDYSIEFAYSSDATWPFEWYFDTLFPNRKFFGRDPSRESTDVPVLVVGRDEIAKTEPYLGNRYYRFDRKLVWWPHQDYYMGLSLAMPGRNLGQVVSIDGDSITVENWEGTFQVITDGQTGFHIEGVEPAEASLSYVRVGNQLAGRVTKWEEDKYRARSIHVIPPSENYFFLDVQDPEERREFWNVLFYREFEQSLADWEPSHAFAFYVRKDVAAQLWDFGAAPLPVDMSEARDLYDEQTRALNTVAVWGGQGVGEGLFSYPRNVAIAPDGSVYVADSGNHRIQKFTAKGEFVTMWGHVCKMYEGQEGCQEPDGAGGFMEPWDVEVDVDGFVYVADTWNHRIQKFDADGNFVTSWGWHGVNESAIGAPNQFWGPRDIAIDADGLIYVSDTGNKRIQVFTPDGQFVDQWGGKGTLDGEFDEPVGIAISADGQAYVADTWNQRIQVFDTEHFFLRKWEIHTWLGQSLENKPYLAVDAWNRVYATDPEGYRILVFDEDGSFVASIGQYGSDNQSFMLPTGIAVDPMGYIWVADPVTHRVLKLAPL
jgi:uncharacterized protein (TIGR03663 family)